MRARQRATARAGVALALVVAATLVGPAGKADPGPPVLDGLASASGSLSPESVAAERVLRAAADAPLTLTRDARGLAHLLGTTAGHPLPALLPPGAGPEAAARAHLARVGPLFGLADPLTELRPEPTPAGLGAVPGEDVILRFQQLRGGVPVLGGELVVVLDAAGALKSVVGETLASVPGWSPDRSVGRAEARRTAEALVAREHPDAYRPALRAAEPELWYLDPALIGVPAARHMPAGAVWRTEVTDRGAVREMVLVDTRTGRVPLRLDMITHLNRVVCDRGNKPDSNEYGSDCKSGYARTETSFSASSDSAANTEVSLAFDNTKRTADFYSKYVGLDLTALLGVDTGDGKRLRSTVRFCPGTTLCSATQGTLFDNAFWNGRGMYYGTGWAKADDIVAHELTHGVTEKTSRLLYLYQSGAINEAMSDIFGELVDQTDSFDASEAGQTPWFVGEDAPLDVLPLRNMADPRLTLPDPQPDRMTSPLYTVDLLFLDAGGVHDNSGVANKTAYLITRGTKDETETPGKFNNQTIAGVGIPKAARLFYRALRTLTSGADYADLAGVLNQSCSDLIGSYGFATSTCDSVKKAVLATELTEQPTGLAAAAAAPEVGYCPTGESRARITSDGFEAFSPTRWSLGGRWALIGDYARTGRYSLYGVEPDYSTSSSTTLLTALRIPRGVKSYLRFAHQYRLDAGPELTGPFYDGALVEYRVGDGAWTSASGLPWVNGPVTNVDPQPGAVYKAFGGDSRGYRSSRVDLSTLAGKTIQLRWRVIGDRQVAIDGWTLDDVYVFSCGVGKPSDVSTLKATAATKKVTVSWTAPVYSSTVTGYEITRTGASAVKVGKSTLSRAFTGLTSGKSYTFTVRPLSAAGAGPSRSVTAKAH